MVVAALIFAGCTTSTGGTSDGQVPVDSGPTTTEAADTPSSGPSSTSSTDSGSTTGPAPTVAQLRSILPAANAAGPDFTAVDVKADASDESGDDDPLTKAMSQGCPSSKTLMDTDSGDPSTYAGRLFNADDNRQIGVYLLLASDPRTGFADKAELKAKVDATNRCPQVTANDKGVTYTVDLNGTMRDFFGTFGAGLLATIQLTGGSLKAPTTIHMALEIFRVGDVDVMVQITSGLSDTGVEAPVNPTTATQIATDLEQKLADLQATQ